MWGQKGGIGMYYGEIKPYDIADGEGVRVSLFVSGCRHHCPECFNIETWAFDYGNQFTPSVEEEILSLLAPMYIQGLTLIGGEPMEPENQRDLLPFLEKVRARYGKKKDIWCYTGCILETQLLHASPYRCEVTDKLLALIDVLVDGPFIAAQKTLTLPFRGSENQRIIYLHGDKKRE